MNIANKTAESPISNDLEQISRLLWIRPGQTLVELGCGRAETTRLLAKKFPGVEIVATEVDQVQHAKNLELVDLPNTTFIYGGAEKIKLPDNSVNYVLMLKSLHHVPMKLMGQSLIEIARVLSDGGLAYVSEPVYAGPFNEILRLFHDEKVVRQAASDAVGESIENGLFDLVEQVFFDATMSFDSFKAFEQRIIGATHTDFNIDEQLNREIKAAFEPHIDKTTGGAEFRVPMRVDLLRA